MGGTASFIKDVGKGIVKGTISAAGSFVPVLGKPVADAINSRFATGGNIGDTKVPEGYKAKTINTVSQLETLVKKYPEIAKKHNLSVDVIREHVEKAKEDKSKPKEEPKMAVGAKEVKAKKKRSPAQIAAFEKMIAALKKKKK
jgi:hypothetical protein